MPDFDALTSESFDFEKLFDSPSGDALRDDGIGNDRTDTALVARERSYRQGIDFSWLLEGARKPTDSMELRQPTDSADATRGLPGLAGAMAADMGMGAVEGPRQIVGGMRDAVQSIVDMGEIADEWHSLGGITFTDEQGNFSMDLKSAAEWRALTGAGQVTEPDLPTVGGASTITGRGVRSIAQFLTGFRLA